MREKIRIFKPIPELDAEIRTIQKPDDKDKEEDYFIVEVGLYESMGEWGQILTLLYDEEPTEKIIIEETKDNLIETKKEYETSLAISATKEEYLKILNRIL